MLPSPQGALVDDEGKSSDLAAGMDQIGEAPEAIEEVTVQPPIGVRERMLSVMS